MSRDTFARVRTPLRGTVTVPGSKSVSNRALVCAALSPQPGSVEGIAEGDDTLRMVAGLKVLGARLDAAGGSVRIESAIQCDARGTATIDAGLAGTTSRFLTAVAAVCE